LVRLNPPDSFASNSRLEKQIKKSVMCPTAGLQILYSPPTGSGKTTASRHVLGNLRGEKSIRGIIEMSGSNFTANDNFDSWFKKEYEIPKESVIDFKNCLKSVSTELHHPCVLFVDHFDNVIDKCENLKHLESMVTGLAEESSLTKQYVFLMVVDKKENYDRLLNFNERKKISPVLVETPFRWTLDELKSVLNQHPKGY
jgi:hypothetical protein